MFNSQSKKNFPLENSYVDLVKIHQQASSLSSLKNELEKALELMNAANRGEYSDALESISAFNAKFNNYEAFDRHLSKASTLHKEIEKAASLNSHDLVEVVKAQIFNRMKEQNYRASLALEGLSANTDVTLNTLEAIKARYVR